MSYDNRISSKEVIMIDVLIIVFLLIIIYLFWYYQKQNKAANTINHATTDVSKQNPISQHALEPMKLIVESDNANNIKEHWLNTTTDNQAEQSVISFWERHSKEIETGDFWADRIKKFKGEPAKRLVLALENLPLPASFREGAIAIRSLIKEKRKLKVDYEEELALLYWLSAINSFSIPYSEVLKEPGYNVIESIPGIKLKALSFSYQDLGYEALELLNKTDIKWLIEAWGEPKNHSTLYEMYIDLWREYENKLQAKRQQEMKDLFKNI